MSSAILVHPHRPCPCRHHSRAVLYMLPCLSHCLVYILHRAKRGDGQTTQLLTTGPKTLDQRYPAYRPLPRLTCGIRILSSSHPLSRWSSNTPLIPPFSSSPGQAELNVQIQDQLCLLSRPIATYHHHTHVRLFFPPLYICKALTSLSLFTHARDGKHPFQN